MISIDLSGKTALVTGASSGLGAAIARTLARAGAAVVVNYHRNRAGAVRVVADIEAAGGRALAWGADVADAGAVQAMFAAAHERFAPVTIVVNNAGREERLAPALELDWDDYQRMVDLNCRAVYHTVRAAFPAMKAAGWGRVVNIGTVALDRPFRGGAAYAAGKGAMLGITRALATELGAYGITVNLVAPGWIPVERHHITPHDLERLARETPLGRYGVPDDVANVVLFFASDLGGFVTGGYLAVSGGHTIFD